MKLEAQQHQSRMDKGVAIVDVSRVKTATKRTQCKNLPVETLRTKDDVHRIAIKPSGSSSTRKKRRRRSAAEIDRKFYCSVPACLKAYGSEGSLIHHQRVKHPELAKGRAPDKKETQVGTTSSVPRHRAARNVAIRPATPLVADGADVITAPRCNLRVRSHSEPVLWLPTTSMAAHGRSARALTPRLRRGRSSVQSPCALFTARDATLRAIAESLPALRARQRRDEGHWPQTTQMHGPRVAQLPVAASSHSRAELAIDCDMLSVLASSGTDDTVTRSELEWHHASSFRRSYAATQRDGTAVVPVGTPRGNLADHSILWTESPSMSVVEEPDAELGCHTFGTLSDDGTNDAQLSTHLKKMSMAPMESIALTWPHLERGEEMRAATDSTAGVNALTALDLAPFPSLALDPVCGSERSRGDQDGYHGPFAPSGGGSNVPDGATIASLTCTSWQEAMNASLRTSATLDALLQHDDASDWRLDGVEDNTEIAAFAINNAAMPEW